MQQAQTGTWMYDYYYIRMKLLSIGAKYWIYDPYGNLAAFCHHKPFKLRDEIVVYSDESMSYPLITLRQQNILDATAVFAIIDVPTNTILGFFGRKYWKSVLQDIWKVYDPWQREIGMVVEEKGRGLIRRFVPGGRLVPKVFHVHVYGREVGVLRQQFKMIGDEWELDFRVDRDRVFDRRLAVSSALLMAIIERHQGV